MPTRTRRSSLAWTANSCWRSGRSTCSPPLQPDGGASARARARLHRARARRASRSMFEWLHCDAFGKEIICEVRLVRLPSGSRRLVRGSIADISERKRTERIAAAERQVFEQLTRNAPLPEVLASITRLIESAIGGALSAVSILAADGQTFASMVAPRLPEALRARCRARPSTSATAPVPPASTSAARCWSRMWARIPSGRAARAGAGRGAARGLVDAHQGRRRAGARVARCVPRRGRGCRARRRRRSWRTPRSWPASPSSGAWREEALRCSEAKFRGLFESIAEGVYQSGRDGRLLSVNPAFVAILGYSSAEELYALPSVALLYWNPADRAEFARRVESEGEIRNAEFLHAPTRWPAGRDARECTRRARRRRPASSATRARLRTSPNASAPSRRSSPRRSARR